MELKEFSNYVAGHIKEYLPKEYGRTSVELNDTVKINDVFLTGLTIRGGDTREWSPNIYLEGYYERYAAGADTESLMEEIAAAYLGSSLPEEFDYTAAMEWETAKDRVVLRLCGREYNKQYLQGKPYTQVADLAATYHVLLGTGKDGNSASVPVTDRLLERYGVSREELHRTALENTASVSPPRIEGLGDMLFRTTGGIWEEGIMPEDFPDIYVLTNREGVNGASVILTPEAMELAEEAAGAGYYILPSSIHEVLVVPRDTRMGVRELEQMVEAVNQDVVDPEDILSSHVYVADRKAHALVLADKEEGLKQAPRQRLFVDMDGTLAEFQQVAALEELYEPGYFLNLPPHGDVVAAVREITKSHPEVEVYIMSSVLSDSHYALEEKNAWLDAQLPEIDQDHRIFPPCGENKLDYVPGGIRASDHLLDDYTANLVLWEPPARGIKLLNGINHTKGTWRGSMLRYDRGGAELARDILMVMRGQEIKEERPQVAAVRKRSPKL